MYGSRQTASSASMGKRHRLRYQIDEVVVLLFFAFSGVSATIDGVAIGTRPSRALRVRTRSLARSGKPSETLSVFYALTEARSETDNLEREDYASCFILETGSDDTKGGVFVVTFPATLSSKQVAPAKSYARTSLRGFTWL